MTRCGSRLSAAARGRREGRRPVQVPPSQINDIFITHLHVDHYADLPYLHMFAPALGARWKPLRVTGPSGRTPQDGTKHMIEHMMEMMHWHTDSFNSWPIGDGFEVEVNEFDFRDGGGICYDEDGVVIRHWRRYHTKDGASAYRLDWKGLSFVWTGDGRPDELTAKFAKGADVFVSELQPDLGQLQQVKMGVPAVLVNSVVDASHTVHYAVGYLMNQIQPRLGMVTHMNYDEDLLPEILAGIRTHYKGFFQFGAPDVVVVNVTKDAIWTRMAALPDAPNQGRPNKDEAMEMFDIGPTHLEIDFPDPKHTPAEVIEQDMIDKEINPELYYRLTSTAHWSGPCPPRSRSRSRRWSSRSSRRSWASDAPAAHERAGRRAQQGGPAA
jgi:ribonuclease Z